MIYVIKVEYKVCTVLKIGYTADKNSKKRFESYKNHNPFFEILFTISGGTEEDEKNLHYKFKSYLRSGREWFSCEQEILDFFTTHTTKESLTEIKRENCDEFFKYKKKYINPVLHNLKVNMIEYITVQENLLNKIKSLRYESAINNYFKINYPDVDFNTPEIISKEVQKILQEFENQQFFTGKMRYLYSLNMDEDVAKQVLNNIYDTHYAKYYWTISASRAGSLKYQKGELEKEYQARLHPEIVSSKYTVEDLEKKEKAKDIILTTFLPDNKYLKSDIKETLRKIYEDCGYNKTPKASDLDEYFELRSCQIKNKETGKKDHGFEILKLKE